MPSTVEVVALAAPRAAVATSPAARCAEPEVGARPRPPRRAARRPAPGRRTPRGDHAAISRENGEHEHGVDAGVGEQRARGSRRRSAWAARARAAAPPSGAGRRSPRPPVEPALGRRPRGPARRRAVAEVDAVEVADDHDGAAEVGRDVVEGRQICTAGNDLPSAQPDEDARPARGLRRRAARTSARNSPSGANTATGPSLGRSRSSGAPDADVARPAASSRSTAGKRRARPRRRSAPAANASASRRGCGPRSRSNGPTAVRRSAVRWPPTPSAAPRSRAIARM